jgi:hypothetical protein
VVFLYSGGSYSPIDPPDSTGSTVWAINDSGQIVGDYSDQNGATHGFIATPQTDVPDGPEAPILTVTNHSISVPAGGSFVICHITSALNIRAIVDVTMPPWKLTEREIACRLSRIYLTNGVEIGLSDSD